VNNRNRFKQLPIGSKILKKVIRETVEPLLMKEKTVPLVNMS